MEHLLLERASCPSPFLLASDYEDSVGYVSGRLCSNLTGDTCCLPCPFTDWVYPDSFDTLAQAAEWVSVVSIICCVGLLVSWAALPVEKTHRHYLSICLTTAVVLLSLGFVIPLAGRPEQCADAITPNDMNSSSICGASGTFLILGGCCAVLWVFMRSMSLHLQICWQIVVGRSFMWFAMVVGWGIPILVTIMADVFSGVSFRLGPTCHVNHVNSLADLWIPLLVFAGLTIVVQLFTFAYCIKVYLASLTDNAASTENSGLPSYSNSIRTMTPRQAYRRVRRVIQLQWRGIAIVLIICIDVIFFSIVFVFEDNTVSRLTGDTDVAIDWLTCLVEYQDKTPCLDLAAQFTVNEATVGAVLILLGINGIWLVLLLGRWSIVDGWIELCTPAAYNNKQREFVSVDARLDDLKKDTRSYEMLSRGASSAGQSVAKDGLVTSLAVSTGPLTTTSQNVLRPGSPDLGRPPSRSSTPLVSLSALAGLGANTTVQSRHGGHASIAESDGRGTPSGRRTPDYFGHQTARYNAPSRSFSSPRPPATSVSSVRWDPQESYAPSRTGSVARSARSPPPRTHTVRSPSQDTAHADFETRHPLGMNRI